MWWNKEGFWNCVWDLVLLIVDTCRFIIREDLSLLRR